MLPNQTLEVNPEEGQPPTKVKSTTTNQSQPMSTNQALEVDRSSQVKAKKSGLIGATIGMQLVD